MRLVDSGRDTFRSCGYDRGARWRENLAGAEDVIDPVSRLVGARGTLRDGVELEPFSESRPETFQVPGVPEDRPAARELIVHPTSYEEATDAGVSIQATFRGLVEDDARTQQICADVAEAVQRRRNCLVLTQWTEHLDCIVEGLTIAGAEPLVLRGGIGKRASAAALNSSPTSSPDGAWSSWRRAAIWGRASTVRRSIRCS